MPVVEDPVTLAERRAVAQKCMAEIALGPIPALIDDMNNSVNKSYEAWPDRLYLIGKNGKIVYKGGPGPFGFKPDELEGAIEKEKGK